MAESEAVAQERPDIGIDPVDVLREIVLHLREFAVPRPAWHFDDAVIFAVRNVGEGAAAPDITKGNTKSAGEVGIDVGMNFHGNGQGEGFADRGQGNMRIVKDNGAGLDRRSSVRPDTKLLLSRLLKTAEPNTKAVLLTTTQEHRC